MSPEEMTVTDRLAWKLGGLVTGRPWSVVALTLVVVALSAAGAVNLEFSSNYRVFFSPENPELVAFEEFQATYTKNDNIMFVLQPEDGDVFTSRMADAVELLTDEAWKIPYAIRVDSISNFQHSWADGDDLTVEDLIRDGSGLSGQALEEKRAVALAEPLLRGNLLSPDTDTTGINVTLQYLEESLMEVPEAASFARDLASRIQKEYPGVRVAITGVSMLNNAFAEAGVQDSMTLMPLMFGVLIIFMIVVRRSVTGTLSTLFVIAMSTAAALGIAGWAGVKLTPISVTAPVIIMTLAIADSVHILVTMFDLVRSGSDKISALRESLRINFMAVAITSITTIVGFLSLNFSDSPPFWHLGNITAVGIVAAFFFSVFTLPALVTILPLSIRPGAARHESTSDRVLVRLADWVTAHHRSVLLTTGTIAIVLIAFIPLMELNDEWVKYFDYRVPFRSDAEFAMDHLNGIYLVEYSLDSGEEGGISDPAYLVELERFTAWLRQQPGVTHVYSYSDVIKRLNKNMHADDPAHYAIPRDRELAAQYLLLYELSLPYGLDLNDRISVDKSATRVTASVGEISTAEVRGLIDRANLWLAENATSSEGADATGATVMFAHISERNINSMLTGNVLALIIIAAIMVFALRSLAIGSLSLLPNAVPIAMTFGLWAVLVGQVGMAAATVSATSLGIVVDDTVHFLAKYLRARREKRMDPPEAIRYAFRTVGRAIAGTTVILVFGFGVLALSTFRVNAQMGLLTALAILLALPTDFLILPSLLMFAHSSKQRRSTMRPLQLLRNQGTLMLIAAVIASSFITPAIAQTDQEKGFEIAARSDRSDRGFSDSMVEMTMVLRNAAGKETTRALSLNTLEIPDEDTGDKSLIIFDSPADIDGTALLSHARILDPDDQWLYLPALKRVKRISSVNKSGPFVGSEFAFEDFTSLELNKFEYKYSGTQPCGELECDVIERYPRYEHSGYTKQIAWIDTEVFQLRKLEFYDRRGDLLKTLSLEDYRVYEGAYWRPHRLAMVNHQTRKSTDLIYSDYRFGTGMDEGDFVKGVLARVR